MKATVKSATSCCCMILMLTAVIILVPAHYETSGCVGIESLDSQPGRQVRPVPKELSLQEFEFEVITIDSKDGSVNRQKDRARSYSEVLGNGLTLNMVEIPGGAFKMGTSHSGAEEAEAEYRRHLYKGTEHYGDQPIPQQTPQHTVQVAKFYIGKFEIMQAQWRAVAQMRKVNRELTRDPSFFKGDNLPVEEVTWEDAVEFCERLSLATGRKYRLPTEAEWEYTCRAGTSTQFHIGDIITPEFVNYNGEYSYGSAPKGIFRAQTTPVGSLLAANAFGLFDMHGNVEEWCLDTWHENYNHAPTDGSAWLTSTARDLGEDEINYRVVRGGSWVHIPAYSRSANRSKRWWRGNKTYFTGFRVVANL